MTSRTCADVIQCADVILGGLCHSPFRLPITLCAPRHAKHHARQERRLGTSQAYRHVRSLRKGHGGKTADWLLISRVFLLSADLSAAAQQSLKNYELFTTTYMPTHEVQKSGDVQKSSGAASRTVSPTAKSLRGLWN